MELKIVTLGIVQFWTLSWPNVGGLASDPEEFPNENLISKDGGKPALGPRTWKAGTDCLDTIVNSYFRHKEEFARSYNMVVGISVNMSTPAAQIQDGYIRLINEAVSEVPVRRKLFQLRVISDGEPLVNFTVRNRDIVMVDFFVFVIDHIDRLKFLMENYATKMRSWNPGALFLVLFNNVEMRDQLEDNVRSIFQFMRRFYIFRVSVLYSIGDLEYSFVLSEYFNKKSCLKLRLKKLGECHSGAIKPNERTFFRNYNEFLGNYTMENCTLRVCASIAPPFVEKDCINGIELRILATMENRFQFKTNLTCYEDTRGVIGKNGSWTGMVGMLEKEQCDFIMGGFYPDNEVNEVFWSSDTYMEDSFTWFYKKSDPRPPFIALYSIFNNNTWLLIIGMLFLSWFFLWFFINALPELPAHQQVSLNGLNALGMTLCASVAERPCFNAGRILFMALTLYGLNLTTLYTSKLIQVLSDPGKLHQIRTLQEAIKKGIPFGGPEENIDWFESPDDEWIKSRYNFSPEFDENTENLNEVRLGTKIILSSRMFVTQHRYDDDLYGFPGNAFTSPLQMIMKAGFPFINDMNRMIRRLRDAGIFEKINQQFIFNNTHLVYVNKLRPHFQENVIVLRTEHLQGPFILLCLGTILSSILFFGELLYFYHLEPYLRRRKLSPSDDGSGLKRKKKRAKGLQQRDDSLKKRKMRRRKTFERREDPFDTNVIHSIRFTPIQRRKVTLK